MATKGRVGERAPLHWAAAVTLRNDLARRIPAKTSCPHWGRRNWANTILSLTAEAERLRRLLHVALACGFGGRKLRCDHKHDGEFQHRIPIEASAPSR